MMNRRQILTLFGMAPALKVPLKKAPDTGGFDMDSLLAFHSCLRSARNSMCKCGVGHFHDEIEEINTQSRTVTLNGAFEIELIIGERKDMLRRLRGFLEGHGEERDGFQCEDCGRFVERVPTCPTCTKDEGVAPWRSPTA